MKFMLSLLALGYVAIAIAAPSLPVHPGGIGGLFKGPNSETIIKGPDGSVITSAAEGGEVHTNLEPIIVAEEVVPVEPVVPVEAVAVPAPPVENKQSSDLIGPSGRIVTQGSQSIIAGPASTTITGPAVLAETVVKGAPVVGTPVLGAAPVAAPIAVTASPLPLVPETDLVAPAVVAAGITSVTAASPNAVATASVSPHLSVASVSASHGAAATASLTPNKATASVETASPLPIISSTAAPVVISSAGIHGVTVNDFNDHVVHEVSTASPLPVAPSTASGDIGGVVSSTVPPIIPSTGQNGIAVKGLVGSTEHINLGPQLVYDSPTPSPLPVIHSTPTPIIPDVTNGIHQQGLAAHGLVGINDRIDLGPRLIHDQLAIDNRQLHLNPALIPSANIIPPEISVTPKTPIAHLRPTPGTLLTTPGLGTVANSPNILREEGSVGINVTPNSLQYVPQYGRAGLGVTPNTLQYEPQSPHLIREGGGIGLGVTPNTLQYGAQSSHILREEENVGLGVTPNTLQYGPQSPHLIREGGGIGLGVTPNTLQYRAQSPHILREEENVGLGVTPNTLQYGPQSPHLIREGGGIGLGVTPNNLQYGAQSPHILREEENVGLGVTTNTLQYGPESPHLIREGEGLGLGVTPNTLQYGAQSPHILREEGNVALGVTPNTLQYGPQPSHILREEGNAALGVTPNTLQYGPQSSHILREDGRAIQYIPQPQLINQEQPQLSSQQLVALQNQQNLLSKQILYASGGQSTGPALFTPTEGPDEDRPGEDPNVAIGGARITPPPVIPQQGVLGSELAKSGVDASQLQLTNVPLSAVSNLPDDSNVKRAVVYNVRPQSRGRYGRQVEEEKKKH